MHYQEDGIFKQPDLVIPVLRLYEFLKGISESEVIVMNQKFVPICDVTPTLDDGDLLKFL